MPRIRLPKIRAVDPPHTAKGHPRQGGRRRGSVNRTTKSSREAIIQALNECDPDGMVGTIKKLVRKNLDNVIPLLQLVTPKQADVTFRNETPLLTIEQLDESLRAAGLPVTAEAFKLDFRGPDPVEEVTEADLIEQPPAASK
jgi:hypothetical protein